MRRQNNVSASSIPTFLSTGELVDKQPKPSLIYVFPEKKLRGLSPNFHIHGSVSNL